MKKFVAILFFIIALQLHYNNRCNVYAFDKGAILTLQGVFCERTVQSSYDVPYLPLEGARRQYEYRNHPDPRFLHPTPAGSDA